MGKHKHHKHHRHHGKHRHDHHEHDRCRCPQRCPDGWGCYGNLRLPFRYDQVQRYYRDWNGWAPSYGIPGYVYPSEIFESQSGAARFNGVVIGHQKFCCGGTSR